MADGMLKYVWQSLYVNKCKSSLDSDKLLWKIVHLVGEAIPNLELCDNM